MNFNFSPRLLSDFGNEVVRLGQKVPSERGDTIEIEGCSLYLEDPRDRIATEGWRKMNVGFAITESLSYMAMDSSLEPLTQFIPAYKDFSTDGRNIDGSYGERIGTLNQLEAIISMLSKNPETRRAVLTIYMGPIDLHGGGGLNTPCTLNLHFLVRDGKLNMHAIMRSNDVLLGLTNDVFAFTLLQEYVATRTGIPLGHYYHYASSMHVYEKDAGKFNPIDTYKAWPFVMNPMPYEFSPSNVFEAIAKLPKRTLKEALNVHFLSQYSTDLYLSAALIAKRKEGATIAHLSSISDETLRYVVSPWLKE